MPSETRKVMLKIREPMSKSSVRHWSKPLRHKIHLFTYRNAGVFSMPYSVCENRHKFAEWLYFQVGCKYIFVFIWRQGYYKDKKRLRPYRIAEIELKASKDTKYRPSFIDLSRISRFSWWLENKRNKALITSLQE